MENSRARRRVHGTNFKQGSFKRLFTTERDYHVIIQLLSRDTRDTLYERFGENNIIHRNQLYIALKPLEEETKGWRKKAR